MLARVARTESTPPLWYALGWVVHRAGASLVDVRLVSVLAGALLAAVVAVLARRVVPEALAALAGVLVAFGSEPVWHGHELRAYELYALLSALFALCLIRELEHPTRGREVALAATVAAGGLTHYFFAFTVVAGLGWLLLDPGARVVRRRAASALLAGGGVAVLWAPVMLGQYHRDRFWWIGAFSGRAVLAVPLRLFTRAYSGTTLGLALSVATLAVLLLGGARVARSSAVARLVVLLALVPVGEPGVAWALGSRVFALRNMIGVAPFVAVTAVAIVAALPRRILTAAAAVGLSAAVAASAFVVVQRRIPPYALVARALVRYGWRPALPIAVPGFGYRAPLEWYLPRRPVLEIARPLSRVCHEVLLVTSTGTVKELDLHVPIRDDRQLRRDTILTDPARPPACLRPIRTGHLAAIA